MQLSVRLINLRKKYSWTQQQLAQILDISANYVWMLESKKKNPSNKIVKKLEKLERLSQNNLEISHLDIQSTESNIDEKLPCRDAPADSTSSQPIKKQLSSISSQELLETLLTYLKHFEAQQSEIQKIIYQLQHDYKESPSLGNLRLQRKLLDLAERGSPLVDTSTQVLHNLVTQKYNCSASNDKLSRDITLTS